MNYHLRRRTADRDFVDSSGTRNRQPHPRDDDFEASTKGDQRLPIIARA
jgi:hypothetical protein